MAAPHSFSLDFDPPLLVQVVLFVALTLVLKPLLFDPMLKLFEEREKLIDGSKLQARRIDEKSATALAEYEAEMVKARALGNAERGRVHAEGLKREQEILSAARVQAARVMEEGRRAAQLQADRARAALNAESGAPARCLGAQLLGQRASS